MNQAQNIPKLIREVACEQPRALAILAPRRSPLAYGRFQEHVRDIGLRLHSLGIGPGDRVAVSLPNGPEMAATFLAVTQVAACAPLNPNYRDAECEFYLSDLAPKALIAQAGVAEAAQRVARQQGIPVLTLTVNPDCAAGEFELSGDRSILRSADTGLPEIQRDDVALILHTSGTTSRPKMVPLTHRNVCASALNIAATLALTPSDRCLNVMPLFHIHGLMGCLLSSMAAGASVVCTPGFQAEAFLTWLRECQPTWYSAVPTIHQAALALVQQQGNFERTLRLIRSSSAAMPARVMADIEATFGVPVIEAYGMTEASHQMTSNPLPPAARKPRSVGLAGHTQVSIAALDRNELLHQGDIGEVVIRGDAVTAGYLSNSEANAKAFFDGWFRTGDRGYLDDEGYLFLQGRLKEMVNRGGENISPLEIDEVLMTVPDVHQAVAFAVPHPTLGEDLAAAVVLKPDACVSSAALREYLFEQVADYKVPSQIVLVDAIPKGATGKLQRIGLADKLADRLQMEFVAPRTDTERAIAAVIQEVLQCGSVGAAENFFVLGGDSLKGTQVTSRLSAQFGLDLPNTILFRYPTVAELAVEVDRAIAENSDVDRLLAQLEGLPPEDIERMLAEAET